MYDYCSMTAFKTSGKLLTYYLLLKIGLASRDWRSIAKSMSTQSLVSCFGPPAPAKNSAESQNPLKP